MEKGFLKSVSSGKKSSENKEGSSSSLLSDSAKKVRSTDGTIGDMDSIGGMDSDCFTAADKGTPLVGTDGQVEPVSLDSSPSHDVPASDSASKQPNVEQLIANAHQNFDAAMNKIDSDIAKMASSSDVNNSSGINGTKVYSAITPLSSFDVAMQSQMYGTNHSVTSDLNASMDGKNASTSGLNVSDSIHNEVRSFANVLNSERVSRKVNFRSLVNENRIDNHDTVLPKAAMEGVFNRYDNTLVGFFVGKNIAFHLVKNYVTNTWGKFGLKKLMKNDDGVFLFKFDSKEGVENVLQRGPWIIRNSPIILTKCTPDVLLSKSEVTKVPVWIKLHNVPLLAYSEDGLSLIATQVGKPIMLDAFTSSMCVDSWGRISFARALVELSSEAELKHVVTMAIPKKDDSGFTTASIKVEYEWKPPHCMECKVFGHDNACCPKSPKEHHTDAHTSTLDVNDDGFKVVQNRKAKPQGPKLSSGINMGKGPKFAPRKQVYIPKKKTPDVATVTATGTPVTTSNSFGTLEVHEDTAIQSPVVDSNTEEAMIGDSTGCSKEADADKGRTIEVNEDVFNKTGSTSHVSLVSDSMGTMDVGSTPIVEKIGKLEKLLIAGKATLVDDDGQIPSTSSIKRANPFSKVGEIEVSDSEDEVVANPFDESANLFGGGQGYEDEYDDYDFDDYSKQVRDLPGNLDVFNAMYGTTFQGPRK